MRTRTQTNSFEKEPSHHFEREKPYVIETRKKLKKALSRHRFGLQILLKFCPNFAQIEPTMELCLKITMAPICPRALLRVTARGRSIIYPESAAVHA
jgi:hypothetical protein